MKPLLFISITDKKTFNYLFPRNAVKLKTQNKHPIIILFSAFLKKQLNQKESFIQKFSKTIFNYLVQNIIALSYSILRQLWLFVADN
ncbi:MAG: hypothetical protein KKF62_09300 [Bacteroidetes bacterium]|nr:hypothetical protein [Bacteroidota bacterium]MBU1116734.1 hypothetical protein [Bacteroidota bacterium]MBU1798133.1 hypothetical protein [Bacteroidota bacterium]